MKIEVLDQLNRTVSFDNTHFRIVSLVPSQTELLYDLGLDNEVVGITKFCIHPDSWFKTKTRVGGTKTVNIERVKSLQPTLIIANKEENTKSDLEALEQICPVWISDVRDLESAFDMIEKIGFLTGKSENASAILQAIRTSFEKIYKIFPPKKVLYVIWNDPMMVVGKDTFIDAMLEHIGLKNAAESSSRYPELTIAETKDINPELIFLSSEPFPFNGKHILEFEKHFTQSQVVLVDGEMFSWYGSRLRKCEGYVRGLVGEF
jgi:ABC-type Fe3+-hydroxamate transport system substrate-binding protein